MHIKLHLDNVITTIDPPLRGGVYKDFKKELGYRPPDYLWRQSPNPNWDGFISCVCYNRQYCKCAVKHDNMHFPTGLISKAIEFFKSHSITYEIFDSRDEKIKDSIGELKLHPNPKFPLYDYQEPVVEKALVSQRGIIKIATGGGKSCVIANIVAKLSVSPTIIYVTSIDLLRQMHEELEKFILDESGNHIKVGMIGGGYKDIKNITVMTYQTAIRALDAKFIKADEEDAEKDDTDISDIKDKLKETIVKAKLIIFDECQHVSCETAQVISDYSKDAIWRWGASATPSRDEEDDILIDSCFGKQICDVKASDLIERGFLVQPHIAFIPIRNLPFKKHGTYPNIYKEAIVENDYRNEIIAKLAVNLEKKGRRTLILVKHIEHGEALEAIIPGSKFIHGSTKKKHRKEHLDSIREEKEEAKITIASVIFDEGINVKSLDALILAGSGKSSTRALQRIGRVIRTFKYSDGTDKKDAYVYDFWDFQKYLNRHSAARKKMYLTEPLFNVVELKSVPEL